MINILLVEDDIDLAATIVDYLEIEDIACDHASNGVAGLNLVESNRYQMLILDINMPKMDGLTLCSYLRDKGIDTPILMLTARDTLENKLDGFEAGADDYLVKPFAMEELVARVNVLSKRRSGEAKNLNIGNLLVDFRHKRATAEGCMLKLSPIAFKLLETLARACPNAVNRKDIMQAIWGNDQPDSNSLKVHVYHLRKELERASSNAKLVTVPNIGFALQETASEGNEL